MEYSETIEYKEYNIKIFFDDIEESPREWDNLGVMACKHRNYVLGDKQIPDSYYNDNLGEHVYINTMDEVKEWIEYEYGELAIILPLGLYDHSGISMYIGDTHDRFDGGYVGYIFITKEKIREQYKAKRITKKLLQEVTEVLKDEVKTYNTYLTGQVQGYQIEDKEENIIGSCGGYYEEDYMISEAKNSIDYHIKNEQNKKEKKLKSYILNHVPLQYRTL